MNESVEKTIIAAMLGSSECCERGCTELAEDDFGEPMPVRMFHAIRTLHEKGEEVDLITVTNMLPNELLSDAVGISESFYTTGSFSSYVDALKEQHRRRILYRTIQNVEENIADPDFDAFRAIRSCLEEAETIGASEVATVEESIMPVLARMGEREQDGIGTGFPKLDSTIHGLKPGELIVVAGRPSMGKSTFALNVLSNVCASGGVGALFTLEDSEEQVLRRIVCAKSRASISDICSDIGAAERAYAAGEVIQKYQLVINDNGLQDINSITASCTKIRNQFGKLDLVVIDYLGLLKTRERRNGTRQQEIGEVTRGLKVLAKRLNTTVMLISQLNRESEKRGDKRPVMSDLRESGDIEQDADVIIFPFREAAYDNSKPENVAELLIEKNRNGEPHKKIMLEWTGEWFLFEEPIPREWKGERK